MIYYINIENKRREDVRVTLHKVRTKRSGEGVISMVKSLVNTLGGFYRVRKMVGR